MYKALTKTYYQLADAIIIAYDSTIEDSLLRLKDWFYEINNNCKDHVIMILVATKCDHPERVISTDIGEEYAQTKGLKHYESSAKNGKGVNELFHEVTKEVIERRGDELSRESINKT